ncbi:hypothetical protein BSKO_02151 [Bryopsis sp. KO-2023]|nr:hypothetical protein BSKO_02151 [Bryopsis sp. KO-2023]
MLSLALSAISGSPFSFGRPRRHLELRPRVRHRILTSPCRHLSDSPVRKCSSSRESGNRNVIPQCWNGSDCLDHIEVEILVRTLPSELRDRLFDHPKIDDLLEIVLDIGRKPHANFGVSWEYLQEYTVTAEDLEHVVARVGEFGPDNRAGIEGTLHRVSCIRNRSGVVIGLTLAVGKPVMGPATLLHDILKERKSILILGPPGIGKTTVLRDVARVMSEEMDRKVMIVDTSNEIGGCGNIPHPFIGRARRLQVPNVDEQYNVMIEAVQNHQPQVVMVDEVGRREEADACRSIGERGVQIIATVHGHTMENLVKNPQLVGLVGGIQTVTIGDMTVIKRAGDLDFMKKRKKMIREREGPSPFDVLVEMWSRDEWLIHDVETSVDQIMKGQEVTAQVRSRDSATGAIHQRPMVYAPSSVSQPFNVDAPPSVSQPSKVDAPPIISDSRGDRSAQKVDEHSQKIGVDDVMDGSYEVTEITTPNSMAAYQDGVKAALKELVSASIIIKNLPPQDGAIEELLQATMKTTNKKMRALLSKKRTKNPLLSLPPDRLNEGTSPGPSGLDIVPLIAQLDLWMRGRADKLGRQYSQTQYEYASQFLAVHVIQYSVQYIIDGAVKKASSGAAEKASSGTVKKACSGVSSSKATPEKDTAERARRVAGLEPLLINLVKSRKPGLKGKKLDAAGKDLIENMSARLEELCKNPRRIGSTKAGLKMKEDVQKQVFVEFKKIFNDAGQGVKGVGQKKIEAQALYLTEKSLSVIGSIKNGK